MKFKIKLLAMIILSLLVIVFVYNDHFLYKTPILKVTSVTNNLRELGDFQETYYDQEIKGIIKNGKYKGKELTFINTVSIYGVYGELVEDNTEVFVELSSKGEFLEMGNIKRDKYIVILLVIFVDLIILVASKKGLKTLLSLGVNIIISAISIFIIQKNINHINMLLVYILVSILFIVFSLFITNGKSKKTLSAIVSSIVSLFVSFTLAFVLIKIYGKDISIWTIEYIEAVFEYENFFYVSILLCGLGAIMDIAITISSSLNELIEKDPKINKKALMKSAREISKDIVGTMTNVMLYTCYTPIIPMVFLAIKNNMAFSDALSLYGEVELICVFTSSISIALAILISQYIAIFILKPKEGVNND